MDNQEYEIKLKVISQAGQVALEFLRANPYKKAKEAGTKYNEVFKSVYQETTDTIAESD